MAARFFKFCVLLVLVLGIIPAAYSRDSFFSPRSQEAMISVDTLPDYYYQLPALDAPFSFDHYARLGDVNGDGFDDMGVVAIAAPGTSNYGNKILLVYHGTATGLSINPSQLINLDLSLHFVGRVNGIGDFNGDGYDDVHFSEVVFFGSAAGLSNTYGWKLFREPGNLSRNFYFNVMDGNAFPAGDLNNDGYQDFLAPASALGRLYIFLGGQNPSTTPQGGPYIGLDNFQALLGLPAGDINGDGFDDFLMYSHEDNADAFLYPGSTQAYQPEPVWRHAPIRDEVLSRSIAFADVNGDGFQDIIVYLIIDLVFDQVIEALETQYTIYGSLSGPDLNQADTLFKRYIDYQGQQRRIHTIGDINADGYEDIHVTPLPTNYDSSIQEKSYILYGSSAGLINNADFHYKEFNYMRIAGDINGDGQTDYLAEPLNDNKFIIIYQKTGNPELPAAISCLPELKFCYDSSGNYSIPSPEITGEIKSINYAIQGTTRRYGSSANASGFFRPGRSNIIWSVNTLNNQQLSCTTSVLVSNPVTVYIKPGLAIPEGAVPGEIYIGYGDNSYRIVAIPAGNSGPYSYQWSDGSTEKFTRIKHSIPGNFAYHVDVTNRDGCTANASITIQVKNVRCISPLEEVFARLFPALYKDPAILKLFHEASEIQVCKNGKTSCTSKNNVAGLLKEGAGLGSCSSNSSQITALSANRKTIPVVPNFAVQVFPNPSRNGFKLRIEGDYSAGFIRIKTMNGQVVEQVNYVTGQIIELGASLKAGIYIGEIVSGKDRKVVKLMKLQ